MDNSLPMPAWKVLGASVAGVSHQQTGAPCQDAFHWERLPAGAVLLAVADGAGSAARSEAGARLAVRAVAQALGRHPAAEAGGIDEAAMREAFAHARQTLCREAEAADVKVREYACTLCVVVASERRCVQASIGDSGAVVCSSEDELRSLTTPQKGEYVNETSFLTGSRWEEDLQFSVLEDPVRGVLVSSDGLIDFLIRDGQPIAKLVTPLFQFVEHSAAAQEGAENLTRFLRSERVTSRVYDDVTLLLAWREACHAV